MKKVGIIKRKEACLVVVDVQERFRPVIHEFDEMVENISKLVQSFQLLKIPVMVTEQNPEKLGETVPEIAGVLSSTERVSKLHFSCFSDDKFKQKLRSLGVKDVILCGIESHVCILKTSLELIENGYNVHIAFDAISSRRKIDKEISVKRLAQSGVFISTSESLIFQLMEKAGTDEFREIAGIIK